MSPAEIWASLTEGQRKALRRRASHRLAHGVAARRLWARGLLDAPRVDAQITDLGRQVLAAGVRS